MTDQATLAATIYRLVDALTDANKEIVRLSQTTVPNPRLARMRAEDRGDIPIADTPDEVMRLRAERLTIKDALVRKETKLLQDQLDEVTEKLTKENAALRKLVEERLAEAALLRDEAMRLRAENKAIVPLTDKLREHEDVVAEVSGLLGGAPAAGALPGVVRATLRRLGEANLANQAFQTELTEIGKLLGNPRGNLLPAVRKLQETLHAERASTSNRLDELRCEVQSRDERLRE